MHSHITLGLPPHLALDKYLDGYTKDFSGTPLLVAHFSPIEFSHSSFSRFPPYNVLPGCPYPDQIHAACF